MGAISTAHYVLMTVQGPWNIGWLCARGDGNDERCVLYSQSDRLVLIMSVFLPSVFVLPPDYCILAMKAASCTNSPLQCLRSTTGSIRYPTAYKAHAYEEKYTDANRNTDKGSWRCIMGFKVSHSLQRGKAACSYNTGLAAIPIPIPHPLSLVRPLRCDSHNAP